MKIFRLIVLFFVINTINAYSQETEFYSLKQPLNALSCTECVNENPTIDLTAINSILHRFIKENEDLNIPLNFKIDANSSIVNVEINQELINSDTLSKISKIEILNQLNGLNFYSSLVNQSTKTTLFFVLIDNKLILNPLIH
jgi:hypothetical protein